MRYPDFLRTAVLLFAASATALAIVAIAGARAKDDTTLQFVALAWWATAAAAGAWVGRRQTANRATAKLLADARTTPLLPELQPGTILFNRLWWLLLFTVAAGAVAPLCRADLLPGRGVAPPRGGAPGGAGGPHAVDDVRERLGAVAVRVD